LKRSKPRPLSFQDYFVILLPFFLCSWGFSSHRCIHDASIQALPEPLFGFFKSHRDWITAHAVDADLRKHQVKGEAEKHFIDLDIYGFSLDSMKLYFPRKFKDATSMFGDSVIRTNGIAPWNALHTYSRLVVAFSETNESQILRNAVDLGHYISDLHVPLHTTSNYNGAETGQEGIHSLWETQLPESFMDTYQLTPGMDSGLSEAQYIRNPQDYIWSATFSSHEAVDSVLHFEAVVSQSMGESSTHAYLRRGKTYQRMRSVEFTKEYHRVLDGQIERRLQQAIQATSSLWYSAWVDAGQPALCAIHVQESDSWIKKLFQWLM
jgi:hypothetical protein